MSTALLTSHMTVAAFENWQPPTGLEDRRWELIDGEPVCMAPPTDDHAAIQSETGRLIGNWLAMHRPMPRRSPRTTPPAALAVFNRWEG